MEELFYIEKKIQKKIDEYRASFKGTEDEFKEEIEKKVPELLNTVIPGIVQTIWEYCLDEKSDLRKREKKIQKKISKIYGLGLMLFEGYLELNTKMNSITYNKNHKVFDNLDDHLKLETLTALHVRACQIASEIKVLVNNGFADGAQARWRTLHEVCITFLFLYDGDYDLMKMYNDYEIIEKWKKAKEYQDSYESLGWEPISDEEMSELESQRKKVIEKYGKDFSRNYGWTMNVLSIGDRNFRGIEKKVRMDHLRAIYTWTNDNIHSGVSGITEKLSLRDHEQHYFLTGPNDYGFLDPIQYAIESLSEMSRTLLNMEDSTLNKIFEELLNHFEKEIIEEFSKQQ